MSLAIIYPEPASLRRKGTGVFGTKEQDVSDAAISKARTVVRDAKALVGPSARGDRAIVRVAAANHDAGPGGIIDRGRGSPAPAAESMRGASERPRLGLPAIAAAAAISAVPGVGAP